MANYSNVKGFTVQTVSSDPVASQAAGGSWASGGALNTARTSAQGSGTSSSSAILGGGYKTPASPTYHAQTEIYNGSAWTEVSDLNQARFFGQGSGTTTAAIVIGGNNYATLVETWDGSSWTEVAEVNTGRLLGSSLGTTTAGIYAGGGPPGSGITNVESWNGSSWTETSYDLNTGKYYMWGTGNSTNAIVSGTPTTTEEFNGSSWTETTESSTDHRSGAASGLKTDALIWGGDNGPGYVVNTEIWNGSSWTELNNLSQGKAYTGGTENAPSGTASALSYGGSTPTQTTSTEEWDAPSTFTKQVEGQLFFNSTANAFKETLTDVPGGTWASGGTMNQSKSSQANIGNSKASNTVGGQTPSPAYLTNNEQYDGTSWTEVNDLNTGRQVGSGIGTSAAGLIAGGRPAVSGGAGAQNESWDGTSFTEEADLNTGRGYGRGAGTQTAAINVGGFINPPAIRYANVETWNGSAWTEITDLNAVRSSGGIAQASPYTSTIVFGGDTGPGPSTTSSIATAETWDGSSWTEVSDLNEGRRALGGAGDSISSALAFGGSSVNTEFWNGSSWTEVNNLSDARSWGGNSGSTIDALVCGDEPFSGATEEWTVSLNNKTITAS